MGDAPSIIAAGTESPTSASQSTAASANQGRRSAAGQKTSVPTPSATSHERGGTPRPTTSLDA